MVFNPMGKHLKDIILSAFSPACTTWGGKNFDIIFCATGKDKRPEARTGDDGGHMFRYKPVTARGFPKFEFLG